MENGHTITVDGIEFEISPLTFDVYAKAMSVLMKNGELNLVKAGSIIFDFCYIPKNEVPLIDIQTNVKLYVSICLKCAELLEFIDVDLKKN